MKPHLEQYLIDLGYSSEVALEVTLAFISGKLKKKFPEFVEVVEKYKGIKNEAH
jgi:hypothetical protein